MKRYRVTFEITSGKDDHKKVVHTDTITVNAGSTGGAKTAARGWVYDHCPQYGSTTDPMVNLTSISRG